MTEQQHPDLDRLVREAVTQAHEHVRRLETEGRLISHHYEYPSLDHFDSGQPRVTHDKGPINYHGVFKFQASDRWSVSFDDVPALGELGRLVLEDENLRARLLMPGVEEMDEWRERFVIVGVASVPLDILDRLINTVGHDYGEDDFQAAWAPMRNGLLWEKLPVEIVVPVCLTTFDTTTTVELAGRTWLEQLPEGEQRARMPKTIWGGAAHDCVVAAATHAITIRGYEIPGRERMTLNIGRPAFYPVKEIELAFEALRIAASPPIGYAQVYMRPLAWAWDYTADLPPVLQGSVGRRYPPAFDNYGWLQPAQVVTEAEIKESATTLRELQAAPKALRLASSRLSGAALRADEDDPVLDLCIALEASVGDRQRSEMTYKLSVRGAAVLGLEDPRQDDVATVLQRVKRLYDWRSAIIHGDDVDRARRRFVGEDQEASGLDVATSLVRRVLRQLVRHRELRSSEAIDTILLLGERDDHDEASFTRTSRR